MKHEVISTPSTENVLRMMFECKTFDEENQEKNVRRFETQVKLKTPKFQTSGFEKAPLKALSI